MGQAGTANEAAAAAGVPIVAFERDRYGKASWYRRRQRGLLGDALVVFSNRGDEPVTAVRAILDDPARRAHMSAVGPGAHGRSGRRAANCGASRRAGTSFMMRRLMPAALGLVYALVPLFPSFIALTVVAFPGDTLISRSAAVGVFGICGVLAVYALAMLAFALSSSARIATAAAAAARRLRCGSARRSPGLRPARRPALHVHRRPRYRMALRNRALLRRPRRGDDAPGRIYRSRARLAATAAIAMVALRAPAAQYAIQHGRATGTFVLPGELAGYFIVFVPIAYAIARVGSSALLRGAAAIAAALGVTALALSYSRAGWMGFAAAVAFIVATRTRHGARGAAVVVAVGAIAVLLLFNAHHDPSEDYTRLSIWQAATQIIDRFPLTGVGPFNFSRLYAIVRAPDADASAFHAHSLYLTFFAEFGIIGVACVAWLMWRFAVELRRRLAHAPQARAFLALSVTAGLVGVAVQGLIDTVSVVIFGLWMPTLGLALAAAGDGAARPGRRALVRVLAAAAAAWLVATAGCNPQPPKATPPPSRRPPTPRVTATPLVLEITREGRRQSARAPHSASPQPRRLRSACKLVREQRAAGPRARRLFRRSRDVSRPARIGDNGERSASRRRSEGEHGDAPRRRARALVFGHDAAVHAAGLRSGQRDAARQRRRRGHGSEGFSSDRFELRFRYLPHTHANAMSRTSSDQAARTRQALRRANRRQRRHGRGRDRRGRRFARTQRRRQDDDLLHGRRAGQARRRHGRAAQTATARST